MKMWTQDEIDILKKYSGQISFKEMADKFFRDRTAKSLQKKSYADTPR